MTLVLPSGPFRCIVADPPWRYKTTMAVTGNAPGRTRQHGRSGTEYPTMTIEEVAAMPVRDILHPDGSHVYLWTTNTHIEHAWRIMRAWGCVPKQLLTWAKKPKGMIGFGAFSPCTEFCLFGSSAARAIHAGRSERTWWEWPRTIKHSEKPQGFFDVVEVVSPGPRLEMFARRQRPGWTVWGNEVSAQPAPDAAHPLAQEMLEVAASTGHEGTIRLAAQLAGVPECPKCGFVKQHCRCKPPEKQADSAGE